MRGKEGGGSTCLLDFGPAASFWLFAFEQMNGVFGSFHTSNCAVEVQLFRKFLSKQQIHVSEWPDIELTHKIQPLIHSMEQTKDRTHCGGLFVHIISPSEKSTLYEANNCCELLPPIKEKAFLPDDMQLINACFSNCFGQEYVRTLLLHVEAKSLLFNGDIFGTCYSRQQRDSMIIIREKKENGIIDDCICTILGFVKCTVIMNFVKTGVCLNKNIF